MHFLLVLEERRPISGPEVAENASERLFARVGVDVADQDAFGAEGLAATRMLAVELSDLVVNDFHVAAIADEARESFLANCARFVVAMIALEVICKMLLTCEDLRAELAVKHSTNLVVELLERDVLFPLNRDVISGAPALEVSVELRSVREACVAFDAVYWRRQIVDTVEMDLQRVGGRVEDIRAHFNVRAGNFLLHMNSSHVSLHVCFVLQLGATQITSKHLRVASLCVNTANVVVQVAFLPERLGANLKLMNFLKFQLEKLKNLANLPDTNNCIHKYDPSCSSPSRSQ